ncbi:MAG: alpha/beta fold hydrolase [Flavobacteriaceae bacterium]
MSSLQQHVLPSFTLQSGKVVPLTVSYQVFGQPLDKAPVVLVNHSLTGNSNVTGEEGWWSDIIGPKKLIDTEVYSIIAFNFPGNGYSDNFLVDYKDWVLRDVSEAFKITLDALGVTQLYAAIGGSIGGALAWEMAVSYPNFIQNIIPIACHWESSDWILANVLLQDRLLHNSENPLEDARIHAMLCYRTPQSFKSRFGRTTHAELNRYNVETWLLHHGDKLAGRFDVRAYMTMNHLLGTVDICQERDSFEDLVGQITGNIYLVSIDTDLFFTHEDNRETYRRLMNVKPNVFFKTITSIHGHDAFLIEHDQLNNFLSEVFEPKSTTK